jgi:hypothetical protein
MDGPGVFNQRAKVAGAEPVHDPVELRQGAKDADHARIAETQARSTVVRVAGGEYQILEYGGWGVQR